MSKAKPQTPAEIVSKLSLLPGKPQDFRFLPTGFYLVDIPLMGGLPVGMVTELSGREGGGKSVLAAATAANVIRRGGRVAWFDAEMASTAQWFEALGIPSEEFAADEKDMEQKRFHYFVPAYLEQGLEAVAALVKHYDLIVYDSIAASGTLAEEQAQVAEALMASKARALSRFRSVAARDIGYSNCAVVFINQNIENLAQRHLIAGQPEGGKLITVGGRALRYMSSLRIHMADPELERTTIGKASIIAAKILKGSVFKSRHSSTGITVRWRMAQYPERGIDYIHDRLEAAQIAGILQRSGAYWYFVGERVANSREAMYEAMRTNLELANSIEMQLNQYLSSLNNGGSFYDNGNEDNEGSAHAELLQDPGGDV